MFVIMWQIKRLWKESVVGWSTCVVRCSEPPRESFGSMGKQHHRMKAMKATLVPTNRMKSSILCKCPKLLFVIA